MKGSYVIKTYRAGTKELLRTSPRIENLVVNGAAGYGMNLIARALCGAAFTTVYPIVIDSAAIGTGTTAPNASQTGLITPVLSNIATAFGELSGTSEVTMSFFMSDTDLANGTYKEFGLFCGGKLLARSLITPNYVKGAAEDSSIDYVIRLSV